MVTKNFKKRKLKMDKWKFVGGNIAIDFVNSIGGRNDKRTNGSFVSIIRDDKLNNYNDLIDWAKKIGIINDVIEKSLLAAASQNVEEAHKVIERAKLLRESLYRIYKNIIEGEKPLIEDLQILNNECAAGRANQKLIFSSNKFSWEFNSKQNELDIILYKVALSGAELLVSGNLSQLKQCRGKDCGWLFIDTSKNHSRIWCDMKDCGNTAKVRRFREKQK